MHYVYLILVLCYVISPYDLFPDFIAGLGWLDDIILLVLTFRHLFIHNRNIGKKYFDVLKFKNPGVSKNIEEKH